MVLMPETEFAFWLTALRDWVVLARPDAYFAGLPAQDRTERNRGLRQAVGNAVGWASR